MSKVTIVIVMYHYVRNMHETDYPDIKGLLIKNFKGQLDYLSRNYRFISIEDYVDFLYDNKEIPKNSCILTFDDGLKDHYVNVFPILKKKKIPGCFFPSTGPISTMKVLFVHKTHFLLAKLGGKKFSDKFNSTVRRKAPELLEKFFVSDKLNEKDIYYLDNPLTYNLKKNIAEMNTEEKTLILDKIFDKYFENKEDFCRELYMNWDEMREMLEEGMSFGAHTINHPELTSLDEKGQLKEIKEPKEILESELKTKIISLSYPYGQFNDTTIKLLKKLKYKCALIDRGTTNDGIVDPFKIERVDTIKLPFK